MRKEDHSLACLGDIVRLCLKINTKRGLERMEELCAATKQPLEIQNPTLENNNKKREVGRGIPGSQEGSEGQIGAHRECEEMDSSEDKGEGALHCLPSSWLRQEKGRRSPGTQHSDPEEMN